QGQLGGLFSGLERNAEMLGREATYHYNLAMIRLELGEPALALDSLKSLYAVAPGFILSPVTRMYWPLLTDDPPPPVEKPFDPEDLIVRKFDPKPEEPKPAEPKPAEPKPAEPTP
ncbi:MAG: hypothetical protein ACRC1K_10840, partial [Planctomycetia bacterium]